MTMATAAMAMFRPRFLTFGVRGIGAGSFTSSEGRLISFAGLLFSDGETIEDTREMILSRMSARIFSSLVGRFFVSQANLTMDDIGAGGREIDDPHPFFSATLRKVSENLCLSA